VHSGHIAIHIPTKPEKIDHGCGVNTSVCLRHMVCITVKGKQRYKITLGE